jgi:hypothetical protein
MPAGLCLLVPQVGAIATTKCIVHRTGVNLQASSRGMPQHMQVRGQNAKGCSCASSIAQGSICRHQAGTRHMQVRGQYNKAADGTIGTSQCIIHRTGVDLQASNRHTTYADERAIPNTPSASPSVHHLQPVGQNQQQAARAAALQASHLLYVSAGAR